MFLRDSTCKQQYAPGILPIFIESRRQVNDQ